MISDSLINPDNCIPSQERTFTPKTDPLWTEHYAFFAYDPLSEHGTFIHIGRILEDKAIWRGVVQIYLPNDELLVGKYFGRDGHDGGAGAGPLYLKSEQPFRRFSAKFDGMLQRTDRHAITSGVALDAPSELAKFSIIFDAAAPIQGKQEEYHEGLSVGTFHTEQLGTTKGEFEYGGKIVPFSGVGMRDHSCGNRSYGNVVSHIWVHGLFPSGLAISALMLRTRSNPTMQIATVFRGDESNRENVEILEYPQFPEEHSEPGFLCRDPVEDPLFKDCHLVLKTKNGPLHIDIKPVHTHAITYLDPCEEIIGTDFNSPSGVQMCDAPAVFYCNGEIGSGVFERSARINHLR